MILNTLWWLDYGPRKISGRGGLTLPNFCGGRLRVANRLSVLYLYRLVFYKKRNSAICEMRNNVPRGIILKYKAGVDYPRPFYFTGWPLCYTFIDWFFKKKENLGFTRFSISCRLDYSAVRNRIAVYLR